MDKIQTDHSYFVIFVSLFLPRLPFQVFNLSGYFLFIVSNFCLDRLFRFSIHRDAHFCLSRPLRVFDLPSCSFVFFFRQSIFLTASAFTGCGSSSPSMVVTVIAPPEKLLLTMYGPS